ncbi:MAG: hypothetical protein K2M00_01945, partial [Muribaculaceae bacterium]|nr:hypothetical protein [Muribaculaceae bacterium]
MADKLIISASLDLAELQDVDSRAFAENPDLANLHLYLVEFNDNGSSAYNNLREVYEAEDETVDGSLVKFKVTLNKTVQPVVLHLIALPKSAVLDIDYGVEAVVIPSLTLTDGVDAYWRRLTFPSGYGSYNNGEWVTSDDLIPALTEVPLIRNYLKISVSNKATGFELLGFDIINKPTKGTVAPWNGSSFPDFLNATESPLEYDDIIKNYIGILPTGTNFVNQISDSNKSTSALDNNDATAKFMYERPFSSIRNTFIVLKGRRNGKISYYKIDLGKNDNNGIFRFFALLRNFNFEIVINSVDTDGYDTVFEAAEGVVYNNLSFGLNLNSLMKMSDGTDLIIVNFTTAVLTKDEKRTLNFTYRYKERINVNGGTYNNENVKLVDLAPGAVIESFTTKYTKTGLCEVDIVCKVPSEETQTQSFIVVNPNTGLGRTINLISHLPWTLNNVKEFAGEHNTWDNTTTGEGTLGKSESSKMTIFFDIPDNLPEVIFPLVFTIESEQQDIENLPSATLVVTSGESYWNPAQTRIKYQKTVTWT